MNSIYRLLLCLYPREYRTLFALEMIVVFVQAAKDRRRQGSASVVRFAAAELAGLLSGACAEWIARSSYLIFHTNSYITGRCLPDRLTMRPAGVSRESYYGGQAAGIQTPYRRSDLPPKPSACVNAEQRFAFASPLRRLLIMTVGWVTKNSCACPSRGTPHTSPSMVRR
jgi:hypothetical protein